MCDKNLHQRNEKKHRKLVRSPEKLSPCDIDPFANPALLTASTNIFINATNEFQTTKNQQNSRTSPTKSCYNDQFPPQQVRFNNDSPAHTHQQQQYLQQQHQHQYFPISTLPPSSSSPSIALHRKPSITIKYSKDDDLNQSPALSHRQQISKSIDSNHPFIMPSSTISSEMKDQLSNNFLINFPGLYNPNSSPSLILSSSLINSHPQQQQHHNTQQQQLIEKNLSPFNYNNDEFNG